MSGRREGGRRHIAVALILSLILSLGSCLARSLKTGRDVAVVWSLDTREFADSWLERFMGVSGVWSPLV